MDKMPIYGFILKMEGKYGWYRCEASVFESVKKDMEADSRVEKILGFVPAKIGQKSQFDFIMDIGAIVEDLNKGKEVNVESRLEEIKGKYV